MWQLTGVETRSSCTAGYKAMWSKADGFPSDDYFAALDPGFARRRRREDVARRSCRSATAPVCSPSGRRRWTGLRAGTPVAVANVDAHASAPAVGVTEPGTFVMIMGTSTCHILLGDRPAVVEGMCGMVEDGVVPGPLRLRGRPVGGRRHLRLVRRDRRSTPHEVPPSSRRRSSRPGQSGLLALDWWNGNRSVLVDADLRGLLVGMTLATKPAEIYRALIEATAFGTRVIVEAFESGGVPVDAVVACGGLPERNKLLMQIYADVLGREIAVGASSQAPALGAAMFAAVAAGEYAVDRRGLAAHDAPEHRELPPVGRGARGVRRALRASTSACTTCSAGAATRRCATSSACRAQRSS